MRKIVMVKSENWKEKFTSEAKKIKAILPLACIHHIGSTAVPGILAKDVIDILVEIDNLEEVTRKIELFILLGYNFMGENGIRTRLFFQKGTDKRTHHIHIFQRGNKEIQRHLNFRDYLIHHPDHARLYEKLKRELAEKYTWSADDYCIGKNDFIRETDKKADIWFKTKMNKMNNSLYNNV